MRRKEATHVHRRRHISNRHLSDKYYYAGEHETVTDIRLTQYNAETRSYSAGKQAAVRFLFFAGSAYRIPALSLCWRIPDYCFL